MTSFEGTEPPGGTTPAGAAAGAGTPGAAVAPGTAVAPGGAQAPPRPSRTATVLAVLLIVVGIVLAGLLDGHGQNFIPRVPTVDALAGLFLGAFFVDRLLTFVPPLGAAGAPAAQRTVDVAYLRFGFGTLLGAGFVIITDLRAVKALSLDEGVPVGAGLDRMIATVAIAGGVVGLARLLDGLNPQPATEDPDDPAATPAAAAATAAPAIVPTPGTAAYLVGLAALVVAALLALIATSDTTPLELLGTDPQQTGAVVAAGTPAVVVRFGVVILLAGIIEQLIEKVLAPFILAKENKALLTGAAAVILGVGAALLAHLFLLHNVGFFGANGTTTLAAAVAHSSDLERWFDTFATGLIIAGGTKPLHDLSSRLRKRSAAAKAAPAAT